MSAEKENMFELSVLKKMKKPESEINRSSNSAAAPTSSISPAASSPALFITVPQKKYVTDENKNFKKFEALIKTIKEGNYDEFDDKVYFGLGINKEDMTEKVFPCEDRIAFQLNFTRCEYYISSALLHAFILGRDNFDNYNSFIYKLLSPLGYVNNKYFDYFEASINWKEETIHGYPLKDFLADDGLMHNRFSRIADYFIAYDANDTYQACKRYLMIVLSLFSENIRRKNLFSSENTNYYRFISEHIGKYGRHLKNLEPTGHEANILLTVLEIMLNDTEAFVGIPIINIPIEDLDTGKIIGIREQVGETGSEVMRALDSIVEITGKDIELDTETSKRKDELLEKARQNKNYKLEDLITKKFNWKASNNSSCSVKM